MKMMKPMRRNSLISPWGVGSMVPFPYDETLMIAGLDMWRYNTLEDFVIEDRRFADHLGVKELRWPPDFRDSKVDHENFNLTIPAIRFPTWYYCPFCGSMRKTTYYETQPECDAYQWKTGRKCDNKKKFRRKMIPERFVVICPNGHIDDFPVAEWVHKDSGHSYDPAKGCRIRRSTGGASSGLSGVYFECTCGAKKSMAGATQKNGLARIEYKCKGSRPWLGIKEDLEKGCSCGFEEVRVVLRGATNVWFPRIESSLYIPTLGDISDKKIIKIVENNYEALNNSRINGELNKSLIEFLAAQNNVNFEKLYAAFLKKNTEEERLPEVTEETSEDKYRFSEYEVLIKSSGNDSQYFHSINIPIRDYDPVISKFFKSISLVPKLKETRAFVGFSRLKPSNKPRKESIEDLRLGNGKWIPAVETYGEGIFFEFNELNLSNWAKNKSVINRIKRMENAYKASFFGSGLTGELRPEFVLIHTFSHLIINQLSFECGYGSSSIRERIYCEKDSNDFHMCGVLIYTASGDSEGSLGGLVRQGEKGRIEDTVISALKNALWCTSDPICIQSLGQGSDSCNLAACHNCALLPETCCESDLGNRLLDRGVVVGTIDEPNIGFFSEIRDLI
ncbi:MAG: DUF1998 domain-containing protein [Lachnospiraceae bacterium]|nr:DUF1998 domain-containing protein [Lachnospiraceae bacterium]